MKTACVLNGFFPHHLDHLGPLSYYLDCPLLVDDPDTLNLAKKYYPQVKSQLKKIDVLSAAKEFELLIFTSTAPPIEMKAMAEYLNIHTLRFAYAPHGFSDKGDLSKRLVNHERQDIALIHGSEQARQLKQYGIDQQVNALITIGNPRRHFYEKYKKFYNTFTKPYTTEKPSILYAPTYNDGFSSSSFKHTKKIIEALDRDYQLIIKLHPLLQKQHLVEVIKLQEGLKTNPNVHLLIDEPIVYPLIEHCDYYLGDFSSIGYEFAQTNKPLFLFASKKKRILEPYANIVDDINNLKTDIQKGIGNTYNFRSLEKSIFSNIDPMSIGDKIKCAIQ